MILITSCIINLNLHNDKHKVIKLMQLSKTFLSNQRKMKIPKKKAIPQNCIYIYNLSESLCTPVYLHFRYCFILKIPNRGDL